MTKLKDTDRRMQTGVRNLDAVFDGGLPLGAVSAISGPPGAGKTVLAQQICFHAASPKHKILYFNTLSEPTAKTLRYLKQFSFFNQQKLERHFHFVDLGIILRSDGLEQASSLVMQRIKKIKPAIVVIDSFKAFDDLSKTPEELRKFGYELAVNLMAWEATGLLLGEYGPDEYTTNPLFSVIDGLILLSQRASSGEQQRFVQVVKLRGADQSRDEHPFVITSKGIEVFAPRVTIRRGGHGEEREPRCRTGIGRLDDLLGEGISRGSSLLVSGVAGTGKTVLLLEFLYRGAQQGEKGILFSFEETPDRLLATARGMGWELEKEIARGMAELVFIPQPDIMVEGHLLMMHEKATAFGARRIAVDSVSVFLHKVKDPQVNREKIFQLASVVQNLGAVALFASDIPYGSSRISRFGVEETVVDGVIVLSATEEGFERQRYIEVYKLRNTAHLKGRHSLVIAQGGLQVFPRYAEEGETAMPPRALGSPRRLGSGIATLDPLLSGGLFERSVSVLAGSPGIGKSTFGMQFVLEGAARKERGLLFTLEEGVEQLVVSAEALGLPLRRAIDKDLVEVVYLSHEHVRAAQFLTVVADKIRARAPRRLVLDSVTHITSDAMSPEDLRHLLYKLATLFKAHDVTSLLTFESKSLYATGDISERGFSPVADNIFLLRYQQWRGQLRPTVTVVKTRGSRHDRGTYWFDIDEGGIRIGGPIDDPGGTTAPPKAKPRSRARRRSGARR